MRDLTWFSAAAGDLDQLSSFGLVATAFTNAIKVNRVKVRVGPRVLLNGSILSQEQADQSSAAPGKKGGNNPNSRAEQRAFAG